MATHLADPAERPFFSVILPVRNEAPTLPALLNQLLEQDYPADRFEILVADGRSTDATRQQVLDRAAASASALTATIRLIDNPGIRSGPGRNAGVLAATGEIFLFIDGHCELPSRSLLSVTATLLKETGAACLCRPQPLLAHSPTLTGRIIAAVRESWLGHGRDSLIYNLKHVGFVDPASSGATYRREVFARIGLYDETFDACEDVEFNTRVRKAGFTAYIDPRLALFYQPRSSLRSLGKQMLRYGRGRARLMRKHYDAFSVTQLAPLALILSCTLAPVAFAITRQSAMGGNGIARTLSVILSLPALCFFCAVAICSLQLGRNHGIRTALLAPAAFAAIYCGLGLGLLLELLAPLTHLGHSQQHSSLTWQATDIPCQALDEPEAHNQASTRR